MATTLSDQEQLLKLLAERGSFDSYDLAQELHKDHQAIVGTIKSLHSFGEVRQMPVCKLYIFFCTKAILRQKNHVCSMSV